MRKPLNAKAYGSIPHLPHSRLGSGDHAIDPGQGAICTSKARDWHDVIVVQEKLDGSCCSVAKLEDGRVVALSRAGYLAETSPYHQHHLFSRWVYRNLNRFEGMLQPGERAVGEWLAQAHGTVYNLPHEPFVLFDLMRGDERTPYLPLLHRVIPYGFVTPRLISYGLPIGVPDVIKRLKESGHGAVDTVEGAVWRVERYGKVEFLAKYVRQDKVDGSYLPEVSGRDTVWNRNLELYGVVPEG